MTGHGEPRYGAVDSLLDQTTFRAEVGWRLRMLRIWDDLKQYELAARAGVSRNYVSATERGTHGLDVWRLWRLATALDVSLGVLLCQEPLPTTRGGRRRD